MFSWLKKHEKAVFTVFLLMVLTLLGVMLHFVRDFQGSGRLVNYTGIVRGASQRMVKLDVLGVDGTSVENYIDEIIDELNTGKGDNDLIIPEDSRYRQSLANLTETWPLVKQDMKDVRAGSYDKEKIVLRSEEFFMLADKLVGSAEQYSHRCETIIGRAELGLILTMVCGALLLLNQYYQMYLTKRRTKVLERKAFVDKHTGLPNKNACINYCNKLNNSNSYLCMMFDLNNLKTVNDTQGHVIGDEMIRTFAYLLRSSVPSSGFVGRYGGDEFVVAIENAGVEDAAGIVAELEKRVKVNNSSEHAINIRYACGWAASSEFPGCLVDVVIGQADRRMYENKIAVKAARGGVEGAFASGHESVEHEASSRIDKDVATKNATPKNAEEKEGKEV